MEDDFSALQRIVEEGGKEHKVSYNGRGIFVALTLNNDIALGFLLEGRHEKSVARRLSKTRNGSIDLKPTDKRLFAPEDKGSYLYTAAMNLDGVLYASSGEQTELITTCIQEHPTYAPRDIIETALGTRYVVGGEDKTSFKRDEYNTPRMAACIRKVKEGPDKTTPYGSFYQVWCTGASEDSNFHHRRLERGHGFFLPTYNGHDGTLLPYTGIPKQVSIGSTSAKDIARAFYDAAGQYKIGVAVMVLDDNNSLTAAVINKSER